MSPTPPEQLDRTVAASALLAAYGTAIDRDSAREMLAKKLDAANQAALADRAALDRARVAAEREKRQRAAATQEARAERKAQAEYDRLMRQTQSTSRTRTRTATRPRKTALEEVLGSPVTKTILTGIVTGIFGTRRRR